jgi:hypothetical protein
MHHMDGDFQMAIASCDRSIEPCPIDEASNFRDRALHILGRSMKQLLSVARRLKEHSLSNRARCFAFT